MIVSDHAALRYRERVRPDLDKEGARAELLRLLDDAPLEARAPSWCLYRRLSSTRYAVLSEDVVVPVVGTERTLRAVTCIARPKVGAESRWFGATAA